MRIGRLLAIVLFVGFSGGGNASGIEPVNPNLDATARRVLEYLGSVYETRMLSGYNVYVHTPDDYEQTGMHAAIWGRDIRWLGKPEEIVAHACRHRYIVTLHWHWFFGEDSAWTGKRKSPVDVGRMVTPGTDEHKQALAEMATAADKLQVFEDADIPVLWRPLHEIDGGWFWWTDKEEPENTARLWRMMYDYFTQTRKLDNLIWVYSAGVGNKTAEQRRRFYPGAAYVDISGIDIYGVDFQEEVEKYWDYFNVMSQVSPGKMLACGECDAIPDPNKTQEGKLPKWLYALPWWGAPSNRRPADWATYTMRHDFIVTLDELPAFGAGNITPHVGLLEPLDDGSGWYRGIAPELSAYAVDRDGAIRRVEFYAGDTRVATKNQAPYTFIWSGAPTGCHDVTVVAVDDAGETSTSNNVRIAVGLVDLALGKSVTASSGDSAGQAVDGNYHSTWSSDKNDDEWIYVDLGAIYDVDQVNLLWGWKIHPSDYSIDVAHSHPGRAGSWHTVYHETDHAYVPWEATYRVHFARTPARYIRMHATRRAGNQTWGGYQLAAFEVPIPASTPR
jgi:hypothetical protein